MRDLLPGLFGGAWDEVNGHDPAAVASLARRPYDEVGLALTRLADQPDPPGGKVGHVLAWHPDYLSRVSLSLAELARLDSGGRLADRPLMSLRGIFLPWQPQTAADTERRREALDLLVDREPGTAWKLLIACHDSASHLHKATAGTAQLLRRYARPTPQLGMIISNCGGTLVGGRWARRSQAMIDQVRD